MNIKMETLLVKIVRFMFSQNFIFCYNENQKNYGPERQHHSVIDVVSKQSLSMPEFYSYHAANEYN